MLPDAARCCPARLVAQRCAASNTLRCGWRAAAARRIAYCVDLTQYISYYAEVPFLGLYSKHSMALLADEARRQAPPCRCALILASSSLGSALPCLHLLPANAMLLVPVWYPQSDASCMCKWRRAGGGNKGKGQDGAAGAPAAANSQAAPGQLALCHKAAIRPYGMRLACASMRMRWLPLCGRYLCGCWACLCG